MFAVQSQRDASHETASNERRDGLPDNSAGRSIRPDTEHGSAAIQCVPRRICPSERFCASCRYCRDLLTAGNFPPHTFPSAFATSHVTTWLSRQESHKWLQRRRAARLLERVSYEQKILCSTGQGKSSHQRNTIWPGPIVNTPRSAISAECEDRIDRIAMVVDERCRCPSGRPWTPAGNVTGSHWASSSAASAAFPHRVPVRGQEEP
ncbi:MAG: hypothetical protein K0S56_1255 [Microvirga sp.]|jgi:hypothetical protein|nr:hypothetical protein [Microvirga sp.]